MGIMFLILLPIIINARNGSACPNAQPITAPKPPQVAASDGPIKIHTPKHDAVREAVKDFLPIDLSAAKQDEIDIFPLEKKKPMAAKTEVVNISVVIVAV